MVQQGNAQLRVDAWRPNRFPFAHDPTYSVLPPDARGVVRGVWGCKNCSIKSPLHNSSVANLVCHTMCKSLAACKAAKTYLDRRVKGKNKLPAIRAKKLESNQGVAIEAKKASIFRRHVAYRARRKVSICLRK